MASVSESYLAGLLARPGAADLAADTYRKYVSVVHSSLTIGGNRDSSVKRILYEVGARHATAREALGPTPAAVSLIDAAYPSGSVMSENFAGLAKKFSNFAGNFTYSNLAGVVERLAKGIAADGLYPNGANTAHLRAGRALRVHALGTFDGPTSAHLDTVFIPRLADNVITRDVFSVLANAIAGEGGAVATDIVELDAVTRQPVVREVDTHAFARACVDALRLLGANMAACDAGDLFAYAVTRGLHSTLSVVGHTDEGGVMRDILRCSGFSVPFGGIHLGLEEYTALPALSTSSPVAIAAWADSLALVTAALVAHCDPGIVYNDAWYPTVIQGAGNGEAEARPGESQEGTDAMADRTRSELASGFTAFAGTYCSGLAKLFGFGVGSGIAARHLAALPAFLAAGNRHLRFPSVAPYYWVEPTSLVPHDFLGSTAELEGFAAFATKNTRRAVPAWESIAAVGASDVVSSGYVATFRGARTCALLSHLQGHPLNGLGSLVVKQLDPTGVIHPGPCAANDQVRDRVEAGEPISSYLWTRGQCAFPAPAEFLNLGQGIGVQALHMTFDDMGIPTPEHLPLSHEFLDAEVEFQVSTPAGVQSGALGAVASGVRRARTKATRALAGAVLRSRVFGRTHIEDLPVLTSAPVAWRPARSGRADPTGPMRTGGTADAAIAISRGARDNRAGNVHTVPVAPIVHHHALNGPQPPHNLAGGRGGGAAPPRGGGNGRAGGPLNNDDSSDDDNAPPAPPAGPAPPAALAAPADVAGQGQ